MKMALFMEPMPFISAEKDTAPAHAGNFSMDELEEGVALAHEMGRKVYLTVNIIPHNDDLEGLDEFVERTVKIGVDALIVADPGVYQVIRSVSPGIDVHLSTQANVTNWSSALYWYRQGVRRIILARELTLMRLLRSGKKSLMIWT